MMKVEPIVTEAELVHVKDSSIIWRKDTSGIELDTNILLVAKENHNIVGLIELTPISRKGILVRRLLSKNQKIAKRLLKEALMCAWEFEYDAAFAEIENSVFYNVGFNKINASEINIPLNSSNILVYSLSYKGLNTFIKKQEFQLN